MSSLINKMKDKLNIGSNSSDNTTSQTPPGSDPHAKNVTTRELFPMRKLLPGRCFYLRNLVMPWRPSPVTYLARGTPYSPEKGD